MDPVTVNLIGAAAATLTTICWLPQAFKILRTRNTAVDLAIDLFGLRHRAGAVAVLRDFAGSWPIIGSNVVTLIPVIAIILLKLRHG